jgi:nitrous oxidase accessory protein NosD
VIRGNTIAGVGRNAALDFAKHGVYVKAPGAVVRGNRISGFPDQGVSLRFAGATVRDNRISGGAFGIAFFAQDTAKGRTRLLGNTIVGPRVAGVYYDVQRHPDGSPPQEAFVLEGNLVTVDGAVGLALTGAVTGAVVVRGNSVLGRPSLVLIGGGQAGPRYRERGNVFAAPALVEWNGRRMPYHEYASATGEGRDSRIVRRP